MMSMSVIMIGSKNVRRVVIHGGSSLFVEDIQDIQFCNEEYVKA
jgi:hypothetical protein